MSERIEIGLNAAIVAMADGNPGILCVDGPDENFADALPSGPFDPQRHRTMEMGLRGWVSEQTSLSLGYVEQLYTFGDRGRYRISADDSPHVVSVGYLALTRTSPRQRDALHRRGIQFRSWYEFLPWEDWRQGRPALLDDHLIPALTEWSRRTGDSARSARIAARVRIAFGVDAGQWDEERALDRYELIYSSGLVAESVRDGRYEHCQLALPAGRAMDHDHRRILATAVSRLRAKMKYRPVIFELMPKTFTLTELQGVVESISGRPIHKQNFRRLVENAKLVEATGAKTVKTGGRPAALFRFRRDVLQERPAPGLRLGRR